MASTKGREKWAKYFTESVKTTIDAKGELSGVPVYIEPFGKGNTKNGDTLAEGVVVRTMVMPEYNARYLIEYTSGAKIKTGYVAEKHISKPQNAAFAMAGTESLGIRAETLIRGGKKITFKFLDQDISAYEFTSAATLGTSIIAGMTANQKVNRDDSGIIRAFEAYFAGRDASKIKWNPEISDSELNQLGKYVGELLVGYMALKKQTTSFRTPLYTGTASRFIIPDDPAFTGVDSFLELTDKTIVPISSKFGGGAKASFFANLFYKVMKLPASKVPPSCFLGKMVASVKKANVTSEMLEKSRGTMDSVYSVGCRDILGLSITTPINVKKQIADGKLKAEADLVIASIGNYTGTDKVVLENLPLSVTAFFSREIAKKLNADAKSLQILKEILVGKNFVQANLNIANWKKGDISYTFLKSGDATISITGSKAGTKDINAKQGTVNYELKY